jgi:protein-disulfide isomerase
MFRALVLSGLLALPTTALAQEMSAEDIKRLALEAILENPEIVMQAVEILRTRDAEAAAAAAQETLSEGRAALERDPNAPVIGNPEGDVTVVEFFDYNCPYCKRAGEQVNEALALDDGIRVVMREWPILGEGSVWAARAALASRAQGRYAEFHEALMTARTRLGETTVLKIAADIGLDVDKLRADMDAPEVTAHIETSMQLAQQLGFSGTPSFVVGETLAPGLIDSATLLDMVEEMRDSQ